MAQVLLPSAAPGGGREGGDAVFAASLGPLPYGCGSVQAEG